MNLTSSTTIVLKKDSLFFERKLEIATEGLTKEYHSQFNKLSKRNQDYRKVPDVLSSLEKLLVQLSREDVLAFLNSFRKSEVSDPLHKWIGTYNLYRVPYDKALQLDS